MGPISHIKPIWVLPNVLENANREPVTHTHYLWQKSVLATITQVTDRDIHGRFPEINETILLIFNRNRNLAIYAQTHDPKRV